MPKVRGRLERYMMILSYKKRLDKGQNLTFEITNTSVSLESNFSKKAKEFKGDKERSNAMPL